MRVTVFTFLIPYNFSWDCQELCFFIRLKKKYLPMLKFHRNALIFVKKPQKNHTNVIEVKGSEEKSLNHEILKQ